MRGLGFTDTQVTQLITKESTPSLPTTTLGRAATARTEISAATADKNINNPPADIADSVTENNCTLAVASDTNKNLNATGNHLKQAMA